MFYFDFIIIPKLFIQTRNSRIAITIIFNWCIWVELDVACADYMRLMSLPPIVYCSLQTCPYYRTELCGTPTRGKEHSPPLIMEREEKLATPIQRVVPVVRQLVAEDIPEEKCTPIQTAKILHHALCVVPMFAFEMMIKSNENTGQLYVSLKWPLMDIAIGPRANTEFPSVQGLVRARNMHPDTHMTMGYFSLKFATAIAMQGQRFFGSGAYDETRRDRQIMHAFQIRINKECLLSPDTKARGSGYYMADVHGCLDHEEFNQYHGHRWGRMEVDIKCIREIVKIFIEEVNKSALAQGPHRIPQWQEAACKVKANMHVSIPAFKKSGCTLHALMGTIDQGINPLHAEQMKAWLAITYDVLYPCKHQDGVLEGENSYRDKMHLGSLKPEELPQ